MLFLKSVSEFIRKKIHKYAVTSHTGFDDRTTFGLMVIASLSLWPFAFYHIIDGNLYMMVITGGLAVISTAIALHIQRRKVAPPLLMLVACMLGNAVVLLAIFHLQLVGIFWAYPLIIFNYSLVGTRVAVWVNITLCLLVSLYVSSWATDAPELPRIIATMAATTFFSHIFSSNIDRQKQALKEMAAIDPLTGVRNRRELRSDMQLACNRNARTGTPVALLGIDIDYFKNINDKYGHAKGDETLIDIARLISNRLRGTDLFYRYGGEEFLVLAGGIDAEGGRILAEDLRSFIHNSSPGGLNGITISVGVAEYEPPESKDEWLARADEALYRAKANGRNRVELALPQSCSVKSDI